MDFVEVLELVKVLDLEVVGVVIVEVFLEILTITGVAKDFLITAAAAVVVADLLGFVDLI